MSEKDDLGATGKRKGQHEKALLGDGNTLYLVWYAVKLSIYNYQNLSH